MIHRFYNKTQKKYKYKYNNKTTTKLKQRSKLSFVEYYTQILNQKWMQNMANHKINNFNYISMRPAHTHTHIHSLALRIKLDVINLSPRFSIARRILMINFTPVQFNLISFFLLDCRLFKWLVWLTSCILVAFRFQVLFLKGK